MANLTPNLGLFKYDPSTDTDQVFSFEQALNDNWDKIDSSVVNKAGDTMTGSLTMYGIGYDPATGAINDSIFLKSSIIDRNTVPSGEYNQFSPYLQILDKNDRTLAQIYYRHATNGTRRLTFDCINENAEGVYAYIGFDASGNPVCSFPNTTCVDGQWTQIASSTVVNNLSVAAGTSGAHTDYDLSNLLPSDSYKYEVWVEVLAQTGNTNGSYLHCWVTSPETSALGTAASIRTPAANYSQTRGRGPVPLGISKKLRVSRSCTGSQGTISVYVLGYRRIGTNA